MVDIKEVMARKWGPMPIWAWTALGGSFLAGVILFKKKASGNTSGKVADNMGGADPGSFSSGQTQSYTDPTTGKTVTSNYTATGPNAFMPGYVTNQAGQMPYSQGDVYVNLPAGPPPTAPPPQQQTNAIRQPLDYSLFTNNDKKNPWLMTTAMPGEKWKDIVSRVYGFGANYAAVVDPTDKARIDEITPLIQNGPGNNSPGSTGDGPAPYSTVFFR